MHDTAMKIGGLFFETYLASKGPIKVADIGSQDVNGSLRKFAREGITYVGVDFVEAKGVDVIITDPYDLPFADNEFDAIVCSSCMEHSEFFWLLFNEMVRIVKPGGLVYINVPSNGAFHRYPVDCWRFYPDSGRALERWGKRSGIEVSMLESFTGVQEFSMWNDFIAVFVKGPRIHADHPRRMLDTGISHTNGLRDDSESFSHFSPLPEDARTGPVGYFRKKLRQRRGRSMDFS